MQLKRVDLIKASFELQHKAGVHIPLGGSIHELYQLLKEAILTVNLEDIELSEQTKETFRRMIEK